MASLTQRVDSHVRNLVINGNFDYWQRGTSFSSANGYTADRFSVLQSGYTGTVTRSTDVPTLAQSGFQSVYSLLLTNGTGASPTAAQYQQLVYRMEGYDYANIHGRKGRVQTWVKSSVIGTFPICFLNAAGNRSYTTTFTITQANTWVKLIFDQQFDNTGTWNFDNTLGLVVSITLTAGSNTTGATVNTWTSAGNQGVTGQTQWGATTGATFQVSQVMIIPEDLSNQGTAIDVPFLRYGRNIVEEYNACLRYTWNDGWDDQVSGGVERMFCWGKVLTTNAVEATSLFPVLMRAAPTCTIGTLATYQVINAADSSNPVLTGFNPARLTTKGMFCSTNNGTTGMTQGFATWITRANGNTSSTFLYSAEL